MEEPQNYITMCIIIKVLLLLFSPMIKSKCMTLESTRKLQCLTGIRTQDRGLRGQLLYHLSYLGVPPEHHNHTTGKNHSCSTSPESFRDTTTATSVTAVLGITCVIAMGMMSLHLLIYLFYKSSSRTITSLKDHILSVTYTK